LQGDLVVAEAWWLIPVGGALLAILTLLWRPLRIVARNAQFARARRYFRPQREHLEAKFVQLASTRAVASAQHWFDCDFDDEVAYVRSRATGVLSAFVAVTVASDNWDESPGSGGAVGNLRVGTAVFRFDRGHWDTDGKAILDLIPSEAIRCYRDDLEMVEQGPARRS